MFVEHVTHFESHWSQFSPNLLDLLCLRVAQVPRSQNNILAIFAFTTTTTKMTRLITLHLVHAHRVIMQSWEHNVGSTIIKHFWVFANPCRGLAMPLNIIILHWQSCSWSVALSTTNSYTTVITYYNMIPDHLRPCALSPALQFCFIHSFASLFSDGSNSLHSMDFVDPFYLWNSFFNFSCNSCCWGWHLSRYGLSASSLYISFSNCLSPVTRCKLLSISGSGCLSAIYLIALGIA